MPKKQKHQGNPLPDMDIPAWCLKPDDTNVTPWLRLIVGCAAGTIEAPLDSPQTYAKAVCARARALAYLMDDYGTP